MTKAAKMRETVFHGTILCCDENDSMASYLVERDGTIAYVGNEPPANSPSAHVVELGECALCPSFVDTHQHFASYATFSAGLNVMEARSNDEIVRMLRDFAEGCKDKMVIAFGASPFSVKEKLLVSRTQLDEACPDKPVMLVKYDGHACVVNSLLLEKIEDKVKTLRGYHPESGEMNQEAFFAVSDYVTNSLSIPQLIGNMQRAMDRLAAKGIGMVHTVSGVGFAGDLDISLEKWIGKSAQSGFQVRVFPQSLDVSVAQKRNIPRIGGCFACALDGCFGSADAALNEPYEGSDSCGVLYYPDETVIEFCKSANRAGLQIEMHAIGDAAFDQATRCLKAALDDCPRKDHRHGIIHACLPTEKGLDICAAYGIHLLMQTSFIDWPQEPDDYLKSILGGRCARLNPLRTMREKGIVLSAGSDAPCTDPDPILWMHRACNHSNPEESITIQEALRMCTYNGSWVTFDEAERGSLEVGKKADMVVLSGNPYTTPRNKLLDLKVEQLYLGGTPYRKQSQDAVRAVLAGMVSKAKI